MSKTLKIDIPEGYEIDKDKSTFENIVFKETEVSYPKNWEDLSSISGCYIDTGSRLEIGAFCNTFKGNSNNKNVFPTLQDAESVLALAQLLQLRKRYVGDWVADWKESGTKCCIVRENSRIIEYALCNIYTELSFPTSEMAKAFSDNHEDLIKTYYKL